MCVVFVCMLLGCVFVVVFSCLCVLLRFYVVCVCMCVGGHSSRKGLAAAQKSWGEKQMSVQLSAFSSGRWGNLRSESSLMFY